MKTPAAIGDLEESIRLFELLLEAEIASNNSNKDQNEKRIDFEEDRYI